MMDTDYFTKVKDNRMGLTIGRTAYNTAVIDTTNKVALDIMNDPCQGPPLFSTPGARVIFHFILF